jgi:hypothetical protein
MRQEAESHDVSQYAVHPKRSAARSRPRQPEGPLLRAVCPHRADAAVEFLRGKLNRFEGWNLVDFRGAVAIEAEIAIDISPTYDMRTPDGFRIYHCDTGVHAGSGRVTGVRETFARRLRERSESYEAQVAR